jgi:similar to stage IV sporulation protein
MTNQELFHWWVGYVRIQIKGKRLERLINRMMNRRFEVWHIRRLNEEIAELSITVPDFFQLRGLLQETGCRAKVLKKAGWPFILKKMRRRAGFAFGLVAFGLLLYLLSSVIWSVEIEGVTLPETEQALRQELANLGVERGKLKFLADDYQAIQRQIMTVVPHTTWVGFQYEGTKAILRVVEKTLPEIEPAPGARHLVAKKKAVIYDLFVERGQPMVKPNQYVEPGDILVSGIIGTEDREQIVAATGKVWGEVWYEGNIEVPLVQQAKVMTGEQRTRYAVRLGDFSWRLWGFQKSTFRQYTVVEDEYTFSIRNWRFPLSWVVEKEYEVEEIKKERSTEEAVKLGVEIGRKNILGKLDPEAEIREENILRQHVENGKVYIKMHYSVIEEIASEQSIIQGD